MIDDADRMLFCDVCGEPACCGFGVTLEGVRMGDVGSWRCSEHHPHRKPRYTREEWAQGMGDWQKLGDITAKVIADLPVDQQHEAAE
jgi:hypothetical protein